MSVTAGRHDDRSSTRGPLRPPLLAVLVALALIARLVAAVLLVAGPWTDASSELSGWDIERFVAIAEQDGRPWRDHPVEYPPASVAGFEALTIGAEGDNPVVPAHRRLVMVALIADLGVAAALARRRSVAGAAYLLLGAPLIPMGLLRFDLLAVAAATAAALVAVPEPSSTTTEPGSARGRAIGTGALTALGAMIKIWPGLLIPALWSIRRIGGAAAAVAATGSSVLVWLWWAGAGLDPIDQVSSLRGATGWHLESVGGVMVSLAEGVGLAEVDPGRGVRLELNAFRIGTLVPWMVTAGRALAIAAIVALAARGRRHSDDGADPIDVLATVMLGSVAALIVTAPLLSPQFLLWLTPWAALLAGRSGWKQPSPVTLTALAALVTGVVLAVFGPPDLGRLPAAAGLAARNLLLLAVPVSCWRRLGRPER